MEFRIATDALGSRLTRRKQSSSLFAKTAIASARARLPPTSNFKRLPSHFSFSPPSLRHRTVHQGPCRAVVRKDLHQCSAVRQKALSHLLPQHPERRTIQCTNESQIAFQISASCHRDYVAALLAIQTQATSCHRGGLKHHFRKRVTAMNNRSIVAYPVLPHYCP